MIFQHTWQQVTDGTKSQTRRLVKPGDWIEYHRSYTFEPKRLTVMGLGRKPYVRWCVGRNYAVQPKRGHKSVARVFITGIRQERLQDMPLEDVAREGIAAYTVARGVMSDNPPDPRWKYIELWDSINTKSGTRWTDNPAVWVLDFVCFLPDVERELIGTMLANPEAFDTYIDIASPSDFFFHQHALIWEIMQEIVRQGHDLNYVIVGEWLRKRGKIEEIGGLAYLMELVCKATSLQNTDLYAKQLTTLSAKRRVQTVPQAVAP